MRIPSEDVWDLVDHGLDKVVPLHDAARKSASNEGTHGCGHDEIEDLMDGFLELCFDGSQHGCWDDPFTTAAVNNQYSSHATGPFYRCKVY